MGGDLGLRVIVEGALSAQREFNSSPLLVGPEPDIRSAIDALGGSGSNIQITHAPDIITMEDSPTRAVVRKPNASMCVAYRLIEEGRASAIISTGNSGAMMAAGILIAGLMPGIKRPAIATLVPVPGNGSPNVIVDSGANVDCHAHNLIQFAIMGAIYCSALFHVSTPRVALLSNGSEPSKGTDILRAASGLLQQLAEREPDLFSYAGYVEGRDLGTEKANVIVCDGFVGNIVLKTLEGCVRLIFNQLAIDSRKNLVRRLGAALMRGAFREVFSERFDYTAYGGAPLLGLRRVALVLHGSSDARAVKNGIRVAQSFVTEKMNERMFNELAQMEESSFGELEQLYTGLMPQRREMMKEES